MFKDTIVGKTLPILWKICVIEGSYKNKTLVISSLSYTYFGTDFAVITGSYGDRRSHEFIYFIVKT